MSFVKLTESDSSYRNLEKMPLKELLNNINAEDATVAAAVLGALPQIKLLVDAIVDKMLAGGRLYYIGAGTSGRLGILDASECVPTFGVPAGLITGIIAGGHKAITTPVEFAEDDTEQGWKDLSNHHVKSQDFVIGLSASGSTPYVLHALKQCKNNGISTGSISCNPSSPLSAAADFPVEIVTGPEFISGSTRMKAGTAQKMTLNMISTAVMVQLGRVEDNKMVHMRLTNEKLIERGTRIVMEKLQRTDYAKTKELLLQYGSVKKLLENINKT
ncbi:MAG: N-acetylmuramic acid 6-phosphate etherase [Ferruginibacter sp.]|nr:N-acetylmuramic acid 6-phosphate etherase [Ferruginibacter sp.]